MQSQITSIRSSKEARQVSGTRRVSRGGFTLVETALAMLVAGIGLTAVMALLPTAMDQGKKASDETYAAFFADVVFASFNAALHSPQISWSALNTYTTIPPVTISTPQHGTDVFWKDSRAMAVRADGLIRTQRFVAASTSGKWGSGMILPGTWEQYDHSFRYRLTARDNSTRRRQLTLEVWPTEYGVLTNAYLFATELFNNGY